MKTYKGLITKLEPNQIFVFGSNTEGRHGAGAALWALKNAGAEYGKPKKFQGQSYAIITKDLKSKKHPSVSIDSIIHQIAELYIIARIHDDLEFLIAYSGKGHNLNGYTSKQMADMFSQDSIPENIIFEEEFSKLVNYY